MLSKDEIHIFCGSSHLLLILLLLSSTTTTAAVFAEPSLQRLLCDGLLSDMCVGGFPVTLTLAIPKRLRMVCDPQNTLRYLTPG